jgi:hypothetical protein
VYQIVTGLPPEHLATLYAALTPEARLALDAPVARMLNSRVPSVRRLPEALKLKALRAWLTREKDEALAGEMLRAYFLGPRKALVLAFLDATGVKHQDGQVLDDSEPDAAKVPDAVKALLAGHDRADVTLYLRVAALQWPDNPAVRGELAALES